MRDVRISGGKGHTVIDSSGGGGGGGGGFEVIALIAGVIFLAALAVSVAQAIAAAVVAALLIAFYCLLGLTGAAVLAITAGLAYRYHKTGTLRRLDRPGRVTVARADQPVSITDARRPALRDNRGQRGPLGNIADEHLLAELLGRMRGD